MNEILPIAQYHHGPLRDRVICIMRLTEQDSRGLLYYRRDYHSELRRLRTAADYRALNDAIDRITDPVNFARKFPYIRAS